jgi:transmembrane sensor
MTRASSRYDSGARLDEAIAWHIRVSADDATEALWEEFTAWLEADPANRAAFDQVEDFDTGLELPPGAAADALPLASVRAARSDERHKRSGRLWLGVAAGLLAASFVIAVFTMPFGTDETEYATRIGEMRTVMLLDGSRVDINTDSRLRVQVDKAVRQVTLERGEALFSVARNEGRPFIVTAGDRKIRDVGTVFDVLSAGNAITVVVAEGRVAVSSTHDTSEREAVAISAGNMLTHSEVTGLTTVAQVDPADALAWRKGYLVYRNAPLSRIVGDLNRYYPARVGFADDKASVMRFSGVLRLDSETELLGHLSRFLPLSVTYGPGKTIILHAATPRH